MNEKHSQPVLAGILGKLQHSKQENKNGSDKKEDNNGFEAEELEVKAPSGHQKAAEEILAAVKFGNAEKLAESLKNFVSFCNMEEED